MIKYPFYALLGACALLLAIEAPLAAQDQQRAPERSQQADKPKRETPYSNRVVQERREVVRATREAEQPPRRPGYRFRDRRPE
jgi:hypothetical protein